MIPVIRWELTQRRLYLLWWCLGVIALVAMLMSIYPSIHQQASQLDQIFKQLPASVRALRGGETDLTSPAGYLNAELFYISLPLLLIIMSVGLGGSLLAKDEQDHTLELLLARPVSRGAVLFGKAVSGIILVLSVGLIGTVATVVLAKVVGMDLAMRYIAFAGLFTTIFSLAFGAIAFGLSAASIVSRRLGIAVAVIASFGGYLIQSLSSASDWIKTPATWLPYHYFVPRDILAGNIDRGFVIYMAAIFLVSAVISYLGFRRRDLA